MPADCARLADETIAFGNTTRQSGQPVKPGVVHDGLAAVDLGEKLDHRAADWTDLRRRLQDLLQPPPEQKPPEQKKNEEKQQDKKQEQQKQDQQKQDQSSKGESSKDQDRKQQQSQEQQKQEQQQQQSGKPPEDGEKKEGRKAVGQSPPPQSKNNPSEPQTQKFGGEQPADEERRENPQLAAPLQKLDQVRDDDQPAMLYQLMHENDPKPPGPPKKDW